MSGKSKGGVEAAMTMPPLLDLSLFMGLVLVLSLYGLAVSGHFPAEGRAVVFRTGPGAAVLWGTIAVSAGVALLALVFAWRRLPLYAAVIGGGAMILIAPLLLQPLPDSFVDGRRGLIALSALGLGLALLAQQFIV